VLERLIESWLDTPASATTSAASADADRAGIRIVHNTEATHRLSSAGRDRVSSDTRCRLPLKGNPGKSLKPSQFDEIRAS